MHQQFSVDFTILEQVLLFCLLRPILLYNSPCPYHSPGYTFHRMDVWGELNRKKLIIVFGASKQQNLLLQANAITIYHFHNSLNRLIFCLPEPSQD